MQYPVFIVDTLSQIIILGHLYRQISFIFEVTNLESFSAVCKRILLL